VPSRIDLSGLMTFAGSLGSGRVTVSASGGGEVDLSKVTAITGAATFQTSGPGSRIRLDRVESINGYGGGHPTASALFSLGDGSIDLPLVQTLTAVSATVTNGQTLNLSSATSYAGTANVSYTLDASGTSSTGVPSRIDLSGLMTFAGSLGSGRVTVSTANGGEVLLGSGTMAVSGIASFDAPSGQISFGTMAVGSGGSVSASGNITGNISNSGSFSTPAGSTLNHSGTFTNSGTFTFGTGSTVHASNGFVQDATGQLRGNGTLQGSLINGGRLAPGNSPGIIIINGDYTQTADGILEIEVGGKTTAGVDFDQVQVSGNASLNGLFEFPIINNFHPQLDDEITFLTANSISGAPRGVFAPNLASVDPSLGFVVIKNTQDLRLRFVTPTDIHFVDNTSQAGIDIESWNEAMNWVVGTTDHHVPTTADIIDLSRSQMGAVERVDVKSADASAYQLSVHDQSSPITVGIMNGNTLAAAVGDVTIGQNATIELGTSSNIMDEGTLAVPTTKTVTLQDGGMLKGNGTISAGDLIISDGTVSPGFSVGHLDVLGNVQFSQGSTFIVDVDGMHGAQHDTVDATGNLELGGKLEVMVATTALIEAGDSMTIIAAGGVTTQSVFTDVETSGSDDLFFAINYPAAGMGTGSSVNQVLVGDTWYYRGDMNHSGGQPDQFDIPYFAMALSDSEKYRKQILPNGACICDSGKSAGDLGGPEGFSDGKLTFDDISFFAAKLGMSNSALLAAMQGVPEPSSIGLSIFLALIVASQRRGRRFVRVSYNFGKVPSSMPRTRCNQ
jgi:hypothetical protein